MRRRKPNKETAISASTGVGVGEYIFDLGKPVAEPEREEYGHRYVPPAEVAERLVHVTALDILEGDSYMANALSCPIARALARTFRSDDVSVSTGIAHINARSYSLPKEARDFVRNFDAGREVLPFVFKLEGGW